MSGRDSAAIVTPAWPISCKLDNSSTVRLNGPGWPAGSAQLSSRQCDPVGLATRNFELYFRFRPVSRIMAKWALNHPGIDQGNRIFLSTIRIPRSGFGKKIEGKKIGTPCSCPLYSCPTLDSAEECGSPSRLAAGNLPGEFPAASCGEPRLPGGRWTKDQRECILQI